MTHEPEMVMYHPFDRKIEGSNKKRPWPNKPWPQRPKPVPKETEPADVRMELVKRYGRSKDEGRSNIEVLSRLAGGTTYRTPDGVGSTRGTGIGIDDLAHALGFVKDPLDQRLALAFACRTDAEWASVQELANPHLLDHLKGSHNTRNLVAGAKKYRARLVLHDAFHDLVLERPPRHAKEAAEKLNMQARDYAAMYKVAAGFLETRAQAGARVAVCALFNE